MTIIEKFEHYAPQCTFAFVLLTPDDATIIEPKTEESQWRARQNVIMELGWFMAKLGRRRVIILHKGQIELPSDIHGMLYLRIERSVGEVSAKIIQRLRAENIIG